MGPRLAYGLGVIRLSRLQREIIVAAQLRADAFAEELASDIGIKERAVRHQLQRLTSAAVIQKAPFVNVYALGIRYVNLYFALGSAQEKTIGKFLEWLQNASEVTWLGQLGGDFNYGMSLAVEHIDQTKNFFDRLPSQFGNLLFDRALVYHYSLRVFPYKYLSSRTFAFPSIGYSIDSSAFDCDDLDREILGVMAKTFETSGRANARAVLRPHATVELRLRRLEQKGVISGYWYMVDPALLGYQSYKLLVYTKGADALLSKKLFEFAKAHPNVVYYVETLGPWSFELGTDVQHGEEISTITCGILEKFGSQVTTVKVDPPPIL
jgi:DNA-binding Lrp family transcriptional regulator